MTHQISPQTRRVILWGRKVDAYTVPLFGHKQNMFHNHYDRSLSWSPQHHTSVHNTIHTNIHHAWPCWARKMASYKCTMHSNILFTMHWKANKQFFTSNANSLKMRAVPKPTKAPDSAATVNARQREKMNPTNPKTAHTVFHRLIDKGRKLNTWK